MAKKSKNGKYLNLEDVRVSYNPKTDIFSVTSADKDLKDLGGLKLDVAHSSSAHSALKELLRAKGVIEGDPWPKLGAREVELFDANRDPRKVPIGTNINGEIASWNIDEVPHLMVYGGTGSGTSIVKRTILVHGLVHGWNVQALDTTGIEFPQKLLPEGTHYSSELNYSLILDRIHAVVELMGQRFEELDRNPAIDSQSFKPTLVVVDDIVPILERAGTKSVAAEVYKHSGLNTIEALRKISELGRAVNIHLVIGVRDSAEFVGYELNDLLDKLLPYYNFGGHLIMGRLNHNSLPEKIRSRYQPFKVLVRGRAHLLEYGRQRELQTIYLPTEKLTELLD